VTAIAAALPLSKKESVHSSSSSRLACSASSRLNSMRMSMRRFTRLTNAHSKKIENHIHAIALHYMHYNFARYHQSLRCSPAMAAGVSKKLWNIEDIVSLLDNPR
jgi:hypothetical protein